MEPRPRRRPDETLLVAGRGAEPALFPEVLSVLTDLRSQGHRLAVSSGSIPGSVERKIRVAGIAGLFEVALGSDEHVPAMAKGPGHFALIAEALATSPAHLRTTGFFIGDGVYDMEIARAAGMTAIGRRTGDNAEVLFRAGAHRVIAGLRELSPLLA